jgi:hypothetical protein
MAERAPGLSYQLEVEVRSPHMLQATLISPEGRRLPTIEIAVSDARLSRSSFENLAADLAALLTQAREK